MKCGPSPSRAWVEEGASTQLRRKNELPMTKRVRSSSLRLAAGKLKALRPVLTQLAAAASDLITAAPLMLTHPFPDWLLPGVRGDSTNLFMTLDLAIKARWPATRTLLTALAGTIPFLSFYFEHIRAREAKAEIAALRVEEIEAEFARLLGRPLDKRG